MYGVYDESPVRHPHPPPAEAGSGSRRRADQFDWPELRSASQRPALLTPESGRNLDDAGITSLEPVPVLQQNNHRNHHQHHPHQHQRRARVSGEVAVMHDPYAPLEGVGIEGHGVRVRRGPDMDRLAALAVPRATRQQQQAEASPGVSPPARRPAQRAPMPPGAAGRKPVGALAPLSVRRHSEPTVNGRRSSVARSDDTAGSGAARATSAQRHEAPLPRVAALGGPRGRVVAAEEAYDRYKRKAEARSAAVDARVQKVLDDIARQRDKIDRMMSEANSDEGMSARLKRFRREQREEQKQRAERLQRRQDELLNRRSEMVRERRANPLPQMRTSAPRFGPDPSQPQAAAQLENRGTSIAFSPTHLADGRASPGHSPKGTDAKARPAASRSPSPLRMPPSPTNLHEPARGRHRSPTPPADDRDRHHHGYAREQHQQRSSHSPPPRDWRDGSPTHHQDLHQHDAPRSQAGSPDAAVMAARERMQRAERERREAEEALRVAECRAAAAAYVATTQQAAAVLDAPVRVVQQFVQAKRSTRIARILRALALRRAAGGDAAAAAAAARVPSLPKLGGARRRASISSERTSGTYTTSDGDEDAADYYDEDDEEEEEDLDSIGLIDSEATSQAALSHHASSAALNGAGRRERRGSNASNHAGVGSRRGSIRRERSSSQVSHNGSRDAFGGGSDKYQVTVARSASPDGRGDDDGDKAASASSNSRRRSTADVPRGLLPPGRAPLQGPASREGTSAPSSGRSPPASLMHTLAHLSPGATINTQPPHSPDASVNVQSTSAGPTDADMEPSNPESARSLASLGGSSSRRSSNATARGTAARLDVIGAIEGALLTRMQEAYAAAGEGDESGRSRRSSLGRE